VVNGGVDASSLVCFNTLLSDEEMSKEILWSNRNLAPSDVLGQGVIFFVDPVEDEAGEFRVMKGFPMEDNVSTSDFTLL
jgi:hypothetical protein